MKSFCDFVQTEKRDTSAAALDIATRYEKAKKATEDLFNNHYENVIASFSDQGKAALLQRIKTISMRMEIVYTNIDVKYIAQSSPSYLIRTLKTSCKSMVAQLEAEPIDNAQIASSILLSQELIWNTGIGTVTTENSTDLIED